MRSNEGAGIKWVSIHAKSSRFLPGYEQGANTTSLEADVSIKLIVNSELHFASHFNSYYIFMSYLSVTDSRTKTAKDMLELVLQLIS